MDQSLDKAINFKHYARMLWRRKGIIVLCGVLCLSSSVVALQFVPKTYESQVTLMIDDNQLLTSELEKIRGGMLEPPRGYGVNEERMAKLAGRIRSRPFLERVIRILKMQEDPMIRARAEQELRKRKADYSVDEMAIRLLLGNLQSRIRIAAAGTGIYKVTVADYSAENAQLLGKWITEIFVDASNQRNMDLIRSAHEFGAEQLRIYEQKLRQSEEALERYKESRIQRDLLDAAVRPDNLGIAEALSRRVADEVAMTRVRLGDYRDACARDLRDDCDVILGNARVRELGATLRSTLSNEVRNMLAGSRTDLTQWPPTGAYESIRRSLLQEVEAEASLRYGARTTEDQEAVARYIFTKLDLEAQQGAADVLTGAIGASKASFQASPGGEIELARLEEDVETNRRLLQSFQSQMVASDVSRAVEVTKLGMQIEILDPANRPLEPSSPNRKKILLASLLLGPMIGLGMAFLIEATDPTLRSIEDFARVIPEPILGVTPLVTRLAVRRRPWIRRHWIPASVTAIVVLAVALYAARDQLLLHVWTSANPVRMVNPESGVDADRR